MSSAGKTWKIRDLDGIEVNYLRAFEVWLDAGPGRDKMFISDVKQHCLGDLLARARSDGRPHLPRRPSFVGLDRLLSDILSMPRL